MRYIITLMLVCAAQIAQAADPFIGIWRLQSTMASAETSMPDIIEMSSAGSDIHYRSEKKLAGQVVIAEYTASYDDRLTIVTGNRGLMAPVKLKLIDEHNVEATYVRGMQIVAKSRRALSADENTMTVTTQTFDMEHRETINVCVYQRVALN